MNKKIKNENLVMAILCVSVIANAFMAGMIVSRPHMPRPPFEMRGEPRMMRELSSVSEEYRDKVEAIIKSNHKAAKANMEYMGNSFEKMKEVLVAPKFDEIKFNDLRKKLDTKDHEMKGSMADMMVSIAKTLPDKERIKFFSFMMENHPRPPMGDEDHGFGRGKPIQNRDMPKEDMGVMPRP